MASMCFPVGPVGECRSEGICVSQVTGGKNLKVAGEGDGCGHILTTPQSITVKSREE